jgi:hypothetical protein
MEERTKDNMRGEKEKERNEDKARTEKRTNMKGR